MFLFQSHPRHIPPTVYLLQPGLTHVVQGKLPGFVPTPDMYMYKIKTKIKKFKCLKVQMLHKHPATLHGLFESICRSEANPEKVLRIRGGAMQVYHHNQ